jgi:hypothetical protein
MSVRTGRTPSTIAVAVAVALAGLTLVAAGCGGSSGEGVAQVGTTRTTTSTGAASQGGSREPSLTSHSACMRAHGVPNFPDPGRDGGVRIPSTINQQSPAFQAAQRACDGLVRKGGSLSPQQQAQRLQQLLAFAKCMRENGVPGFPDPKLNADGGIGMDTSRADFDSRSPQFRKAENVCRNLLPAGARNGKDAFGGGR